ncbi:MAG: MBL fold metallo-hydrolase [Planctomycetes bacterium]|nr:MBL fold metallo-hydrolase [Planctomycetota bacterium]MDP6409022.1 MBL fold metallo-hydrolase [Planctomycetota bacterium]
MRLQVLSSGSEGNAYLLRAGEVTVLVDAGLGVRVLSERMQAARLAPRAVDHLLVTHGHLDHSRSAGAVAKRQGAVLHCAETIMTHRALDRAPRKAALPIGGEFLLDGRDGRGSLAAKAVLLPHDCDPTVAFRFEHAGRVAVILTDMGHPRAEVARALAGAHILVLESNHDPALLRTAPYPQALQERIRGDRGHLSNEQAATMLADLAHPGLHTLVLAHISKKANRVELALEVAVAALERLGLGHVRVLAAAQDAIGPALEV